MCKFIGLILPATANIDGVREILASHQRRLDPAGRDVAGSMLAEGESAYTTCESCDCGTTLGRFPSEEDDARTRDEKRVRELRKKGWSEAKISRWRAQRSRSEQRSNAREEDSLPAIDVDVEAWFALLSDVLASGHTPKVGIRVAWAECADLADGRRRRAPLVKESLRRMKEAVVYEFRA